MYIIIVGAGKIGYFLAKRLAADKHTVALIEKTGPPAKRRLRT